MKIAFATIGIPFDGSSLEKTGLGGSESACIYLARELAKRGHAVTVFCRCRTGTFDGVCYLPIERFAKSGRWDVAVVYRYWELAHPAIDAEVIIGWSQDLPNPPPLLAALWQIDRLAVLTDYHADAYLKAIPEIGPLLFRTGNGVDAEECFGATMIWERTGDNVKKFPQKKDPRKLIYTSRPERGLVWLLSAIFPKLLEKFPDLKLYVATYDFPFEMALEHQAAHALCNALIEKLGDSVVKLGSLSKRELYREMATAAALVYPCDYAGETSCMTVLEAQACGLWVVTTNDYALRETAAGPGCIRIAGHPSREMYQATFIEAVENILEGVHGDPPAAKVPTWGEIAEQWESVLEGEVLDRHRPLLAKARKTTTIACCMIVKNEAANLARCLASVRPFVDKLHILDTGSTDQTMEVARQFRPDSLVNVPFTDFADMRNESKFPASSDWIFWIDADEVLVGGENLRKYARTRFHEGYAIQQVQVHMQDKTGKTVADTPIRLFRNRPQYKFVGIIHEHCLAGDTLIDLPGERVMIKDLVGRSDFWLWSYSHGDGKVVLRKADRVWKVGFQQTIEVILDDGFFRCTPEHLVMLRNGSYKQADQLRAGDSLMPFYRSMLTKRSGRKMIDEWHVVLNNEMTAREHRYIWEQIHGPIAPGNQIHHKDRCHTNNLPGNLESLTHSDHSRLTLSEWNKRDRVARGPARDAGYQGRGKAYWHSKSYSKEEMWALIEKHQGCFACVCNELDLTYAAIYDRFDRLGMKLSDVRDRFPKRNGHPAHEHVPRTSKFLLHKSFPKQNHKVVAVRRGRFEEVFDISVPETHNFAANGVFVHNCENTAKGPYDNAIAPAVLLPDVEIHHFGYTTEKVRRGKVTDRNMALMIRSLLEEPDRQLTRALALRDLTNVAAWHFTEHGPIDPDSVQHRCLQAAVDAWIDLFGDEDHKYHGMSYPFYQEALVLLAANGLCAAGRTKPPFCVAWGVLGSMMALDKTKLVGRVRWWPDEQQFTQFVLHSCAAVVQQLAVSEAPRAVKPVTAEDTANLLKLGIAKLG